MPSWKILRILDTELKFFVAILLVTQILISSILLLVKDGITGRELI